jgi:hypothetical protein
LEIHIAVSSNRFPAWLLAEQICVSEEDEKMNMQFWNEELEIYESDSLMDDDSEPVIKLWQTERTLDRAEDGKLISNEQVIFTIKDGYKLVINKDVDGKVLYIISKKRDNEK